MEVFEKMRKIVLSENLLQVKSVMKKFVGKSVRSLQSSINWWFDSN